MKIILIGHARHGKDTVAQILQDDYGMFFRSSSEFCAEKIVFPVLQQVYHYKTIEECFADRVNHRAEWFNLIRDHNSGDLARLGRDIFSKYDIYCGLRNAEELKAMKEEKIYDFAIWVDASSRFPEESTSSNTITPEMADYIIDNNDDMTALRERVRRLMVKLSHSQSSQ